MATISTTQAAQFTRTTLRRWSNLSPAASDPRLILILRLQNSPADLATYEDASLDLVHGAVPVVVLDIAQDGIVQPKGGLTIIPLGLPPYGLKALGWPSTGWERQLRILRRRLNGVEETQDPAALNGLLQQAIRRRSTAIEVMPTVWSVLLNQRQSAEHLRMRFSVQLPYGGVVSCTCPAVFSSGPNQGISTYMLCLSFTALLCIMLTLLICIPYTRCRIIGFWKSVQMEMNKA